MNERPKTPPISPQILSTLTKITDGKERRAFLDRWKLKSAKVVLQLNDATQQEFRINTTNALALAEAAVDVARAIRKKNLLAQSLRVKANVLAAAGEYQPAIDFYKEALEIFESVQDEEGIARTLTAIIQPFILLGAYQSAFEAAERAQIILTKNGDERRLARLDNNLGNIYHRQDRFEEALACYERAHGRLIAYGDSEELTISLNNISMCLIGMNDFAKALATYERAKVLLNSKNLSLIQLITDYNIAYLYYLRGDYRLAIEMLKAARVAGEEIGYTYLVALCYLDLSDIYVELNLSVEAQEVAREGFELFQKLEIGYEAAKALTNQAIALGQAGKFQAALELFAQARTRFVHERNEVWPWLIDLYQAIALYQQTRHFEARRLAIAADGYFANSTLRSKAVLCKLVLAQIAMQTANMDEAEVSCETAQGVAEKLDVPILRFHCHFMSGQLRQLRADPSGAYHAYQQARLELESLRSSLGRDELKISFMKNKAELYERLVELTLSGRIPSATREEAFAYIESAKSRSLSELMFRRSHPVYDLNPGQSAFVQKIRDLREELNWYQHRIELEQLRPEHNSKQRIEGLRKEAQTRERELLKVLGENENESASAGLPIQQQLSLDKIQVALAAKEIILEYFFAGDRILVCLVSRNGLEVFPVSTVSRVEEQLRLLRFQLGKVPMLAPGMESESLQRTTVHHLRDLYDELIGPIRDRVEGHHLVVVPHGILHCLPFHALFDGEKFLIDRQTVSYAPSAAIYAVCQAPPSEPGQGSLVLGVPDQRAPLIENEVETVHRTLQNSELFLGEEVDHDLFAAKAPKARLLHVATHGNFRPDNPMFSGIRLSDGYLYLYELYQTHLSAELMTLSGCATGLNVVAAGDELVGLIRGALYAGARSLLLCLWDVNDQSTAQFMTSFYKRLAEGTTKAQAAAEATRELQQTHPHPYFWAPFLIVGKALNGITEQF